MNDAQVLIVDDDPALLEALPETLRLRMDDVCVDTSDSGEAALQRIRETDYDALVVDIKMPGMDGLELLSEIRRICPDTPTILITGHGDHDLAVQAMRLGAQDYVTKPIDREYFVGSLKRAIECYQLGREVATKRQELLYHTEELEASVQERTVELREALHREQIARQELGEANLRLARMSQQRDIFVSMVAHDLATPLTTIRGFAELLGHPNVSSERRDRARSIIISETGRLARLATNLVDATQLVAGSFRIQLTPCNLSEIVKEQIDLALSRTERHIIRFESVPNVQLACDRDRVSQVLSNLLSNAIKYAPSGDIDVQIQRGLDEVILSVSDQGPGIPLEKADLIFELGQRLTHEEAPASIEGSGLGLHITKGIVEAHGGRIWVDQACEQGAIFRVAFPMTHTAETATSGARSEAAH